MARKRRSSSVAKGLNPVKAEVRSATSAVSGDVSNDSGQSGRLWWRKRAVHAAAPAALAFLASLNSLWNGWVADDFTQIVTSVPLRKLSNIPLSFVTSVWSYATADSVVTVDSYYRPLFMTLFTINYAIAGLAPWAWHLINVLIHAAVTLLVFVTIKELTSRPAIAALTAALFAVHPVHAESVAWVSGITDPLLSLFLLPAFLFYLVALFAKETALALPLLIAYCEIFHFKEGAFKNRLKRAVLLSSLLAPPTIFYVIIRYIALNGILFGTGPQYPFNFALMTIPLAILKYLKLMSLPWGQSYQHYTEFVTSMAAKEFLLPLIGVCLVIAALIYLRSRMMWFGAVWFILVLAPALLAMRQFDREYLLQDRYLYIPSIGFCLAAALMIDKLSDRWGVKLSATIAIVLILVFGAANVRQNRMWKDGETIFANCVDTDPGSAEAHLSLGRIYFESGRVRDGDEHVQKALELAPGNPSPYLLLSFFARQRGKLDQSIEYIERGIAVVPQTPVTRFKLATLHLNLALLYGQTRNLEVEEHHLLKSIEIWPRATGWFHAGQFYLEQARYQEAITMFEKARSNVPEKFSQIHLKLGQTYDRLGQTESARAEYQRFLELAPDAPESGAVKARLARM
jgi:tetratricopeptide (TPR) repeat protein